MLIAIASDSHDDLEAARHAAKLCTRRGAERILHAGDFVSASAASVFAETGLPVDAVLGNGDRSTSAFFEIFPQITRAPRLLDIEGRPVILVHERHRVPDDDLAAAEVLVHGHTHRADVSRTGRHLVINPGEVCGTRTGSRTIALWNTAVDAVEILSF